MTIPSTTLSARAMAANTSNSRRAAFWGGDTGPVWANIDQGVNNTLSNIRVVQTVISGTPLSGMSVPQETVDFKKLSIEEGLTLPYVEIAVGFSLSNGQVQDPSGATAVRLAKLAAKDLALAEDLLFLQGDAGRKLFPTTVRIESGQKFLGEGLLGQVKSKPIQVRGGGRAPSDSGESILAAVVEGLARLSATQSGPYYLIADLNSFIATCGMTINGIPTSQVVTPALLGGSICSSAAMPANTALLIATGGDPTTIYVDTDPITEPTQQEEVGRYAFRTYERVQYVASDPRAFVTLDFSKLEHSKPGK